MLNPANAIISAAFFRCAATSRDHAGTVSVSFGCRARGAATPETPGGTRPAMYARMSRKQWCLTTTVIVPTLLGLFGCRQPDFASRRVAMREERLAGICKAIGKSEQRRPSQLARTAAALDTRIAREDRASRTNVEEFRRYWRRDWGRLNERCPLYRRADSSPEQVERYAIILFY